MHPVLSDARRLDGGPLFYPPGQHPATARYRAHLARLRECPPSRNRNMVMEHVETELAAFEEGESIAKAVYLQRRRGFV